MEEVLNGVKLDSDDKETLRHIYDNITDSEERNKALHTFL